eukprot:237674_1
MLNFNKCEPTIFVLLPVRHIRYKCSMLLLILLRFNSSFIDDFDVVFNKSFISICIQSSPCNVALFFISSSRRQSIIKYDLFFIYFCFCLIFSISRGDICI